MIEIFCSSVFPRRGKLRLVKTDSDSTFRSRSCDSIIQNRDHYEVTTKNVITPLSERIKRRFRPSNFEFLKLFKRLGSNFLVFSKSRL